MKKYQPKHTDNWKNTKVKLKRINLQRLISTFTTFRFKGYMFDPSIVKVKTIIGNIPGGLDLVCRITQHKIIDPRINLIL